MDSIPGLGRSPAGVNDNPLQYSCLGNPMDRGTWQATVHGLAKSQTYLSYSVHTHTFLLKYFEEEITISQGINNHSAILFQTKVTSSILCMSNPPKKKKKSLFMVC